MRLLSPRKWSRMPLILINTLMTVSILCFYVGYFFRKKNTNLHRIINSTGVVFNLTAAVYLLLIKYVLGGIAEHSIFPTAPSIIILIHRIFASISLFLMLTMAYSGWKRNSNLHLKLHYIFLPLYTIVYISGLFLFQSQPL